jgi:pimeloyl-ACP methyl ester carboxylesterase
MQSHYPLRPIGGDIEDTYSLFAINPSRKAIIFIHGYSGDPLTTWSQFDSLLPLEAKSAGHDLFFYGYDGLFSDMAASAGIFAQFLRSVAQDPTRLLRALPPSVTREPKFQYDEITIVAHSLGAVITRWALLDLRDNACGELERFRMVLFAPAHKGARVDRLAAAVGSGFPLLGLLWTGFRFSSPLVEQLAENSAYLAALETRTQKAIQADGKRSYLVARRIFIAEYEKIVRNLAFAGDPPATPIPKKSHMEMCKPTELWRAPLDEVLNEL